ncbi:probable G-protein coupled receptor 83 [Dromiciops gliroides]|uniref:probable G-protein coupled receptor 83 n=1 Tax=Dromiciops gliroides TaxID=33562 RepID=UPI001CC4B46A|nr:probable G-protein coupled receptor 83 [Dromiciops gliroides]
MSLLNETSRTTETVGPSVKSLLYGFPDFSSTTEMNLSLVLSHGEGLNAEEPFRLRGLFIFAYFSILLLSVFGNSVVGSVILQYKRVHSVTGLFIINLTGANMLLTLLNTSFALVTFIDAIWVFGYMMCHLNRFVQFCYVYVSVLTFVALAVDRYEVTMRPLKPLMTTRKVGIYIIIIWTLASFFSLLHAIYQKFPEIEPMNKNNKMVCFPRFPIPINAIRKYLDLITFVFLFFLPLVVILVAFSLMAKKLWAHNSISNISDNTLNYLQKKKMTLKMLVTVVVVFAICWFPLFFYEVFLSSGVIYSHQVVYFASHCFAMSSTCYNPIIYYWLNQSFRNELNMSLHSWWQMILSPTQAPPESTFHNTLTEVCPFWDRDLELDQPNEDPSQYEETDLSAIHPIIEIT